MNTTIDCTDIKAMLSAFIDGELDEQTRHMAERHVSSCPVCRDMVDEIESLDALVALDARSGQRDALSPSFVGNVLSRTVYSEPPAAARRPLTMWAGWLAAAACMMLAAALWMQQNQQQSPSQRIAIDDRTQTPEPENRLTDDSQRAPEVPAPRMLAADTTADDTKDESSTEPIVHEATRVELPAEQPQQLAALSPHTQPIEQPQIALTNEPAAEPEAVRSAHTLAYSTGIDLESRTFEGALPADAFFVARATQPEPPTPIADAAIAAADETLPVQRPTIDRQDADALYAASIVLDVLRGADLNSFAAVEQVRRVVEADELLVRLTEARDRLQPSDRPAVFAAESVLTRVTQGPLDTEDVRQLRETVASLNLSHELGDITHRWDTM